MADWADEKAREIVADTDRTFGLGLGVKAKLWTYVAQALREARAEGVKEGLERAATVAFEKIRCDDRTDRWQVANEVAAHIRALSREADAK